MFKLLWSWLLPLVAGVVVFAFVLMTTPPGFVSLAYVFVGGARGATADAAAYAVGAAASLSLIVLLAFSVVLGAVDVLFHRR